MYLRDATLSTQQLRAAYDEGVAAACYTALKVRPGSEAHCRLILILLDSQRSGALKHLPPMPSLRTGEFEPQELFERVMGRPLDQVHDLAYMGRLAQAWESGVVDTYTEACARRLRHGFPQAA